MFAGEDQQTRVVFRCTTLAYDKDGNVKRSRGVYYDDLGFVWGSEPDDNS